MFEVLIPALFRYVFFCFKTFFKHIQRILWIGKKVKSEIVDRENPISGNGYVDFI